MFWWEISLDLVDCFHWEKKEREKERERHWIKSSVRNSKIIKENEGVN